MNRDKKPPKPSPVKSKRRTAFRRRCQELNEKRELEWTRRIEKELKSPRAG